MNSKCQIRQYSDEKHCLTCHKSWDAREDEPPCPRQWDVKAQDDVEGRTTYDVQAEKNERAARLHRKRYG